MDSLECNQEEIITMLNKYANSKSWWILMCHHEDLQKIAHIEAFVVHLGLSPPDVVEWHGPGLGVWFAFSNKAVSAQDIALLTGVPAEVIPAPFGYFMLVTEGTTGSEVARSIKEQFPQVIEHTVEGRPH